MASNEMAAKLGPGVVVDIQSRTRTHDSQAPETVERASFH